MGEHKTSLSSAGISGVILHITAFIATPVRAGGEPTVKPEPSAQLAPKPDTPKVETVVTPSSTPKARAGTGITLGESNAPPNFEEANGITPLHLAAATGDVAHITYLIAEGMRLDLTTHDGATALHWAAAIGHLDIITILVESGADLEAITAKGQTPLHIATALDQILVVTVLLNAGANLEASLDPQYPEWRQGG